MCVCAKSFKVVDCQIACWKSPNFSLWPRGKRSWEMLRSPQKEWRGGDEDFFLLFLFFKHNKNRFLPFSTPPPEMTWKPPRIAVGYASLSPSFYVYIFEKKKKRPSCKHVEDGSKLQTRRSRGRRRRWPLSADASFIIFSTGRTTQKFWPSEHEFDTRVFRPIAPLSFFFFQIILFSPPRHS